MFYWKPYIQSTLILPTLDTTTKFLILTIWQAWKPSLKMCELIRNYAGTLLVSTPRNICFGYLTEKLYRGDSDKYPKHTFYEGIRKHGICLHIILLIKDSLQQHIHFNGNIFGNECCICNEGSMYTRGVLQLHALFLTHHLCRYSRLSLSRPRLSRITAYGINSKTSMTRIPMAHLPWLIRTRSWVPWKLSW